MLKNRSFLLLGHLPLCRGLGLHGKQRGFTWNST